MNDNTKQISDRLEKVILEKTRENSLLFKILKQLKQEHPGEESLRKDSKENKSNKIK